MSGSEAFKTPSPSSPKSAAAGLPPAAADTVADSTVRRTNTTVEEDDPPLDASRSGANSPSPAEKLGRSPTPPPPSLHIRTRSMSTGTASKGIAEKIFTRLSVLTVLNSEEWFDAFLVLAQSEGCKAYLLQDVPAPASVTSAEYGTWERARGKVLLLFMGYLGPNAEALVVNADAPNVNWERIKKHFTQKGRLTGMAALKDLASQSYEEGADIDEFITHMNELIRRVNRDLKGPLEQEAKRAKDAGETPCDAPK
ncbi:hypothetical protein RQP46_008261 [Phenoliferia psychrophenolica]